MFRSVSPSRSKINLFVVTHQYVDDIMRKFLKMMILIQNRHTYPLIQYPYSKLKEKGQKKKNMSIFLHILSTKCHWLHMLKRKKRIETIIKPHYCFFCSFVVNVFFVNFIYSSYLHFQEKLGRAMQQSRSTWLVQHHLYYIDDM